MTTSRSDREELWNELHSVIKMLDDFKNQYTKNKNNLGAISTWTDAVGFYTNYRSQLDCQVVKEGDGCDSYVSCTPHDETELATAAIVDAFSEMKGFYTDWYNALSSAGSNIGSNADIVSSSPLFGNH